MEGPTFGIWRSGSVFFSLRVPIGHVYPRIMPDLEGAGAISEKSQGFTGTQESNLRQSRLGRPFGTVVPLRSRRRKQWYSKKLVCLA